MLRPMRRKCQVRARAVDDWYYLPSRCTVLFSAYKGCLNRSQGRAPNWPCSAFRPCAAPVRRTRRPHAVSAAGGPPFNPLLSSLIAHPKPRLEPGTAAHLVHVRGAATSYRPRRSYRVMNVRLLEANLR